MSAPCVGASIGITSINPSARPAEMSYGVTSVSRSRPSTAGSVTRNRPGPAARTSPGPIAPRSTEYCFSNWKIIATRARLRIAARSHESPFVLFSIS